jgi:hypothetical protein
MKKLFCLLIVSFAYSADIDLTDTTKVEFWTRHDLGFICDTVDAVVYFRSADKWYIRTPDGERWSDIAPREINKRRK